ncbi:MAG: sensor histidine kinase/response regulator [Parcubacteria bacterium C7867-001]|nr:MAG: sensor histidine kinase/response regulator [Parcubacteria bacterium C7867-001]
MATYKIYLVDDDRFLLDMYAVKFKNAGHDVSVFQSAEDALNALRKDGTPNAVLADIIMPNMTGFEFLEAVKKEDLAKDAKLIVLSNQGQDSDIEKAKELGAAGYIIKASAIPSEVLSETLAIIEKK